MTSTVVVKANHGRPIDVTVVFPKTGIPWIANAFHVAAGDEMTLVVHSGQDLLVHEVQPDEQDAPLPGTPSAPILKYFAFEHLQTNLQQVIRPLGLLAAHLDASLPDGPEKSAGLRKLLEAKDCFVRAKLG
jgi:hypothetical protein